MAAAAAGSGEDGVVVFCARGVEHDGAFFRKNDETRCMIRLWTTGRWWCGALAQRRLRRAGRNGQVLPFSLSVVCENTAVNWVRHVSMGVGGSHGKC